MEHPQKKSFERSRRVKSFGWRHRDSFRKAGRLLCKLAITVGSALLSALLRYDSAFYLSQTTLTAFLAVSTETSSISRAMLQKMVEGYLKIRLTCKLPLYIQGHALVS